MGVYTLSGTSHEVHVEETDMMGWFLYRVMVDYVKYDEFTSKERLTWADQRDVARYYRTALDNYLEDA